jgi:hypothetical protein
MTYGVLTVGITDTEPNTNWRSKDGRHKSAEIVIRGRLLVKHPVADKVEVNTDSFGGYPVHIAPPNCIGTDFYTEAITEARFLLRDKDMIIDIWGEKRSKDIVDELSFALTSSHPCDTNRLKEECFDETLRPLCKIRINVWGSSDSFSTHTHHVYHRKSVLEFRLKPVSFFESCRSPIPVDENPLSLYKPLGIVTAADIEKMLATYNQVSDEEAVEKRVIPPHNVIPATIIETDEETGCCEGEGFFELKPIEGNKT